MASPDKRGWAAAAKDRDRHSGHRHPTGAKRSGASRQSRGCRRPRRSQDERRPSALDRERPQRRRRAPARRPLNPRRSRPQQGRVLSRNAHRISGAGSGSRTAAPVAARDPGRTVRSQGERARGPLHQASDPAVSLRRQSTTIARSIRGPTKDHFVGWSLGSVSCRPAPSDRHRKAETGRSAGSVARPQRRAIEQDRAAASRARRRLLSNLALGHENEKSWAVYVPARPFEGTCVPDLPLTARRMLQTNYAQHLLVFCVDRPMVRSRPKGPVRALGIERSTAEIEYSP
jgi:hypothetical protein